ncbi:alpha-N-acetylglucosaminidase-like isoform X2 [Rutidosis leptorrhynchoides]|uniref:alpha-N-acetylglucosaminidase-like isoform X2 n=1 Tax=Rutidosis leptorrhynchoides TaxID=125765 RepID=UPI003A990E4C
MTAYVTLIFTIVILLFTVTHSSTVGVQYVSGLLQIQDRERASSSVQISAARAVLDRFIPSHSSSFDFQIITKEHCGGVSCFMISNLPTSHLPGAPEIRISGVTGVELLTGLHWYLKNLCGAHISWDKTGGSQLSSVPKAGSLPRMKDDGLLIQRPVPWNYYQNAVTSSYTFAWWDWQRWEKEIDWMALHGINMPLAFTGQEAIWQKVFEKFNISNSELGDFFGGPAFLAWSRMANLHGWGGPLPQSWLDQQLAMQKKILARMYELGMTPVLPAFSGNVPAALKNVYPSAKITRLGNWFTVDSNPKWCCTYLLDATDPLFIEIGKAFISQQIKEYGRSSHIYNCDTFDENTPPTDDPEYISSLAAAIFKGMQSGDDDAVWLMQGWLFAYDPYWRPPQMQALLDAVPIGKMIVLDLFAEVTPIWTTSDQFYGVPYIWCMLHNFAGNVEMYGVLDSVGSGPVEARISNNSTMVGVGMSMEGIEQNPIVYDLMSEMAFQRTKIDVKDKNRDVIVAFPDVDPSFLSSRKTSGTRYLRSINPLSKRFSLKDENEDFDKPHLWYSTSEVIRALELFIDGGNELSGSNTYRYDVVDLTRQALAKFANDLFLDIIEAYDSHDADGVAYLSKKFLDLVDDMDALLACHEGFLLGPWLESSKQLAINEEQKKQYEWNARTQITMWFDNTEEEASLLRDYGNKYWSGLLRDYYGPRAAIYFKYLIQSFEKGESFDLKGWRREWIKLTNNWQNARDIYPVKSEGDALVTSRWLFEKYLRGSGIDDH